MCLPVNYPSNHRFRMLQKRDLTFLSTYYFLLWLWFYIQSLFCERVIIFPILWMGKSVLDQLEQLFTLIKDLIGTWLSLLQCLNPYTLPTASLLRACQSSQHSPTHAIRICINQFSVIGVGGGRVALFPSFSRKAMISIPKRLAQFEESVSTLKTLTTPQSSLRPMYIFIQNLQSSKLHSYQWEIGCPDR